MDTKTIFVLTPKGEDEVSHKTSLLYGDIKRALSMVDGTSTYVEISKRAAPSLRSMLAELIKELLTGGYIQDKVKAALAAKIVVPPKMVTPAGVKPDQSGTGELDFTTIMRAPTAEILRAEAAKIQAEKSKLDVEQKNKQVAELAQRAATEKLETENVRRAEEHEARLKAVQVAQEQEAIRAKELTEQFRLKTEQEAKIKAEAETKAKLVAEQQAKAAVEAARLRAEQEAQAARVKAEQQALQIKQEAEKLAKEQAELARLKAEQEAEQLRKEAELAKQKAIDEAKAQQVAQALRIKAEQEAAQAKEEAERRARAQAEFARLKVEQEAEQLRKEAELVKQKAEAEAKARDFAERRAKVEAEALRVKAEQAAEKIRVEQEARLKAEAELKARAEIAEKLKQAEEAQAKTKALEAAALKAQQQAESARLQAEQDAVKVREEAERIKQQAEAQAKTLEAATLKAQQQAESARLQAEQDAVKVREEAERVKQQAEAQAKALEAATLKAQQQAESARLQAEQDAVKVREEAERVKQQAEAQAKALEAATLKAQQQAESARLQAEQDAAKAIAEAARVKQQAEVQAKAIEDLTRKAREEADAIRVKTEQETAKIRAELDDAKLKIEQENKARLEAEAGQLHAEKTAAQTIQTISVADLLALHNRGAAQQLVEQQAIKAREEEQKRAKQHALAAASTQVRDTPYDTSKPSESPAALKLDDFDFDAITVKTDVPKSLSTVIDAAQTATVLTPSAQESAAQASKANEQALKEQVKQAEQAREAEELAAKKLADTQAKAWAEAEQRAAASAKAHVEHLAQQSAQSAEAKQQSDKKLRAVQAKRKPLPWGGIAVGLLAFALLSVFLVPMMLPTQEYAAKVEAMLTEKLHQPVHIGKLSARILPTPRIDLGEFYIGEVKQIKAQQAQLSFGFTALFGGIKRIENVELLGAELNGSGLLDVPSWLQKMSADAKYPISRITFSSAKLNADAVQLNDLEGELGFTPVGQFNTAVLRVHGKKLLLDIKVTPEGKLETVFNLRGEALPLLPNWNFEELTAKGELSREGFVMDDIDGRIASGVLQGKARIDWKSGWSAQGTVNVKSVALGNINHLLEGDMDGAARFKMQADSLAKLSETAVLEGNFIAKKGVINGIDIVETARLHSKENLPGGRTHFDEINSTMTYSNGVYHFKSMKILNSVLNSTANIDIVKQQLSGRASAHLSITEGMGTVDLQVGGATDNPTLRAGR